MTLYQHVARRGEARDHAIACMRHNLMLPLRLMIHLRSEDVSQILTWADETVRNDGDRKRARAQCTPDYCTLQCRSYVNKGGTVPASRVAAAARKQVICTSETSLGACSNMILRSGRPIMASAGHAGFFRLLVICGTADR
jgi:hypothetical protein